MKNKVFTPIFDFNIKLLERFKNHHPSDILIELLELKKDLDYSYHSLDNPQVDDAAYDEMVKMINFFQSQSNLLEFNNNPNINLKSNNNQNNLFAEFDNPASYQNAKLNTELATIIKKEINKVGSNPLSIFKKIEHKKEMLSLSNVTNQDEFLEFVEKVNRFLNYPENNFFAITTELKIDGLGFSATYQDGILKHIATRGDGYIGEDVTANVLTIDNFVTKLKTNNPPKFIEIRGEIFMNKNDFDILNKEQEKNKQKIFANPRNAAAGSLRQIDNNITKTRKLKYIVYTIGSCSDDFYYSDQCQLMSKLQDFGFIVNDFTLCNSVENVISYYKLMESNRNQIPFDVDGIVCKINNKDIQNRLGYLARSPRWAVAFKFSSISAITKIIDIEFGVGRTGLITPVAILNPVNIGGVIVKKSTLHNFDEIQRLGVYINADVVIQRAGDVIPKIISCLENTNNQINKVEISKPTYCPCCNSILHQDENGILLRCKNKFECKEQIINAIEYFCSKDAFDIIGLAKQHIITFYNLGFLQNVADIFVLESKYKDKIINLEGFGEKSANNLFLSINSRKKITLNKFIYSLGFYGIGEVMCKMLAKHFKTAKNLLIFNYNEEEINKLKNTILEIDGIGMKTINELILTLLDESFYNILIKLIDTIEIYDYQEIGSSTKHYNKKIVFTGSLQNLSRNEAKYQAEQLGFTVMGSISKNIDFVVCGQDAGGKLKKAQELNIQILTEQDWLNISKNNNL